MPLTKWLINRAYFGHLELDQPYLGDLLPLGIKERIRYVKRARSSRCVASAGADRIKGWRRHWLGLQGEPRKPLVLNGVCGTL